MKGMMKKIPGFRSGKRWKMAVSILVFYWPTFSLFIAGLVTLFGRESNEIPEMLSFEMIIWGFWIAAMGFPYLVIFNIFNLKNRIPLIKAHTLIKSILAIFIYMIIWTFILNGLLSVHVNLFGPINLGEI